MTRLVRHARFEQDPANRLNCAGLACRRALPGRIRFQIALQTKMRRAVGVLESVWKLPKNCNSATNISVSTT
jgi:hypothetical protein